MENGTTIAEKREVDLQLSPEVEKPDGRVSQRSRTRHLGVICNQKPLQSCDEWLLLKQEFGDCSARPTALNLNPKPSARSTTSSSMLFRMSAR